MVLPGLGHVDETLVADQYIGGHIHFVTDIISQLDQLSVQFPLSIDKGKRI